MGESSVLFRHDSLLEAVRDCVALEAWHPFYVCFVRVMGVIRVGHAKDMVLLMYLFSDTFLENGTPRCFYEHTLFQLN